MAVHGVQPTHKHVVTVISVAYLAQTLELWDQLECQADTVLVNVNQLTGHNQVWLHLQVNVQQVQTQKRGVTVHVMLTGRQVADKQDRVHIAATGQNVVQVVIWVDQEWSK